MRKITLIFILFSLLVLAGIDIGAELIDATLRVNAAAEANR